MCLTHMYVTLTDNFQYLCQLADIDNISLPDQRKNVQITNKVEFGYFENSDKLFHWINFK